MARKSDTKITSDVDGDNSLVPATPMPALDVINAFNALRHYLGIANDVSPQAACDHIKRMHKTSLEQQVTLSLVRSSLGTAIEASQDDFEGVPDHQLPDIVSNCYTSYKFHRELLKDAPNLHPETLSLFLSTAKEMLKALANGEHGRPPLAWMAENWAGRCKQSIKEKIRAGDYVDAINYLMFAHYHNWNLTGLATNIAKKTTNDVPYKMICDLLDLPYSATGKEVYNAVKGQSVTLNNLKNLTKNDKRSLREDICDYLSMNPDTATARQILDKIKELSEYASMAQPDGPVVSYEFGSPRDLKNYQSLCDVLFGALHQAAYGKGRERHANDEPFESQRMQVISDQVGSVSGMAYQVVKKVTEALNMPTVEQQERELYGAINYTAGMLIWLKRHDEDNEV